MGMLIQLGAAMVGRAGATSFLSVLLPAVL